MNRAALPILLGLAACTSKPSINLGGASSPLWSYVVSISPDVRTLSITADLPPLQDFELEIDEGFDRFVSNLESWSPECKSGCRIAYTYDLFGAASASEDVRYARRFEGGTIVAPPSTWLVRPADREEGARYRFQIAPGGPPFTSGVRRIDSHTYEAEATTLWSAPFSVFGPHRTKQLGAVELAILPGAFAGGDDVIHTWVGEAERCVREYYGRFPVERALVIVAPSTSSGFGTTLGNGGASIFMGAKTAVEAGDLDDDWQMTHEMVHLAFPNQQRRYHWLEEGLATYVEPIARARCGRLDPKTMWRDLVRDMPNGLPERGDRGLDRTSTWGRLYWGGAMFCLLADLEIRKETNNARSIDDALRGILAEGGNIETTWAIEKTLEAGDRATGTHVLTTLHARYGAEPVMVDLETIWRSLGIRSEKDEVVFDDAARLAAIRRAITDRSGR